MVEKPYQYSRREFLWRTTAGIGSLSIDGFSGKDVLSKNLEQTNLDKKIIYRTLGRTGLKIPIVSMGVMNASVADVLMESYKMGVRHFDTAWYYQGGLNEMMVGNVIKRLGIREQVIVSTKVLTLWQRRGATEQQCKERLLFFFEESLRRLQMDYVDILYLHETCGAEDVNNAGIQEALTLLRNQKKIRFAGLSTHTGQVEVLNEAAKSGFYDVILVAFNFAMSEDKALLQVFQNAYSKGIGLIAMKTQAGGDWWRSDWQKSETIKGSLNQTAMLKWVLRHDFITTAIPGYTNFDHMREDFSVVYDLEYTPEEKKFLKDKNTKYSLGFCRQCRNCLSTCTKGVDIPTLMRTHMYAYQYHNMDQVYSSLNSIKENKNLSQCQSCSLCKAKCTYSLPIAQKIVSLKELNLYQ